MVTSASYQARGSKSLLYLTEDTVHLLLKFSVGVDKREFTHDFSYVLNAEDRRDPRSNWVLQIIEALPDAKVGG